MYNILDEQEQMFGRKLRNAWVSIERNFFDYEVERKELSREYKVLAVDNFLRYYAGMIGVNSGNEIIVFQLYPYGKGENLPPDFWNLHQRLKSKLEDNDAKEVLTFKINQLITKLKKLPGNCSVSIQTADALRPEDGELKIEGVNSIQSSDCSTMLDISHTDCPYSVALDHYDGKVRFLVYKDDQDEPIAEYS
jgi:hypothetical protein